MIERSPVVGSVSIPPADSSLMKTGVESFCVTLTAVTPGSAAIKAAKAFAFDWVGVVHPPASPAPTRATKTLKIFIAEGNSSTDLLGLVPRSGFAAGRILPDLGQVEGRLALARALDRAIEKHLERHGRLLRDALVSGDDEDIRNHRRAVLPGCPEARGHDEVNNAAD